MATTASQHPSNRPSITDAARSEYLTLPPNIPADPEQLESIYDVLQPEANENNLTACLTAGNIALELCGAYGRFRPHEAATWNQVAETHLKTVVDHQTLPLRRLDTQRQLDVVPSFSPVNPQSPALLHKRVVRTSSEILGHAVATHDPDKLKEIEGLMLKQLVILTLADLATQGIVAYPSLSRERIARASVDKKPYRWDATVESAGRALLPKGVYLLRIAAKHRSDKPRHSDISVAAMNVILPKIIDQRSPLRNAYDAALRVATGQGNDFDNKIVNDLRQELIKRLRMTGTQRSDTRLLAVQSKK